MRWVVCCEEGIEKSIKFSLTCVANVANVYGAMLFVRGWLPQCVSKGRICDRKSLAKDIVVGHIITRQECLAWSTVSGPDG